MNMFRESKKRADKKLKERSYKRDENGRIIINMVVKNDDYFLSSFSEESSPVISSEVAEFIEDSTHSLAPKENITLRIYSDCIDDEEKNEYREAIKEYYLERYIKYTRELKRNYRIALLLLLSGIAVLACGIIWELIASNPIWAEVIDIGAWVLLWEAFDITVLRNIDLRAGKFHCISCLSMNVEYYPLNTKWKEFQ